MSEHIKTGVEIFWAIDRHSSWLDNPVCFKLRHEQWVSVSWLKEQIEYGKKDCSIDCGDTFLNGLDWVLSLLEES